LSKHFTLFNGVRPDQAFRKSLSKTTAQPVDICEPLRCCLVPLLQALTKLEQKTEGGYFVLLNIPMPRP